MRPAWEEAQVRSIAMKTWFTSAVLSAAVAIGPACKSDAGNAARTEKVIEDTRDEAAERRADIQDKQEELVRKQGELASDRGEFMATMERKLADLDRKVQEVRARVQERSPQLQGEARNEIQQGLTELENAQRQAKEAYDGFQRATSEQVANARQQTETAIERAGAAHDALRGRVNDRDDDPDSDLRNRNDTPETSPSPGAGSGSSSTPPRSPGK